MKKQYDELLKKAIDKNVKPGLFEHEKKVVPIVKKEIIKTVVEDTCDFYDDYSFGEDSILDILKDIKNSFIYRKELKKEETPKEDFYIVLDRIINCKLDIKPLATKIIKDEKESTEIEKKELFKKEEKNIEKLGNDVLRMLRVDKKEIEKKFIQEVYSILKNVYMNYQYYDLRTLNYFLDKINKYKKDGIDGLSAEDNADVIYILNELHTKLEDRRLSLMAMEMKIKKL